MKINTYFICISSISKLAKFYYSKVLARQSKLFI